MSLIRISSALLACWVATPAFAQSEDPPAEDLPQADRAPLSPVERLAAAEDAWLAGSWDEAIDLCTQAIDGDERLVAAHRLRLFILEQLGDFERASPWLALYMDIPDLEPADRLWGERYGLRMRFYLEHPTVRSEAELERLRAETTALIRQDIEALRSDERVWLDWADSWIGAIRLELLCDLDSAQGQVDRMASEAERYSPWQQTLIREAEARLADKARLGCVVATDGLAWQLDTGVMVGAQTHLFDVFDGNTMEGDTGPAAGIAVRGQGEVYRELAWRAELVGLQPPPLGSEGGFNHQVDLYAGLGWWRRGFSVFLGPGVGTWRATKFDPVKSNRLYYAPYPALNVGLELPVAVDALQSLEVRGTGAWILNTWMASVNVAALRPVGPVLGRVGVDVRVAGTPIVPEGSWIDFPNLDVEQEYMRWSAALEVGARWARGGR